MNREASVGETEYMQESADKGETLVHEVIGKVIKRWKSYHILFQLGIFMKYEEMNLDLDLKVSELYI